MYEVKGVLMVSPRPEGSFRSVKVNKPHIYWCKQRQEFIVHIQTSKRLCFSIFDINMNYQCAKWYIRQLKPLAEKIKCATNSVT